MSIEIDTTHMTEAQIDKMEDIIEEWLMEGGENEEELIDKIIEMTEDFEYE